MFRRTQRILLLALLASYLLVGVLAHLEALTQFLGFGIHPHQVTRNKPVSKAPAKVYWTQYKHIPVVTKVPVPSPAVLHTPETPRGQHYDRLSTAPVMVTHPARYYPSSTPRAPPVP